MHERALGALREVLDPELGLSIVDLGLVYDVEEVDDGVLRVTLTTTSPACPLGESIMADVEARLGALGGVTGVQVEMVWDPPWTPERMSPQARRELGWGA